jgi:hypothetical protein
VQSISGVNFACSGTFSFYFSLHWKDIGASSIHLGLLPQPTTELDYNLGTAGNSDP